MVFSPCARAEFPVMLLFAMFSVIHFNRNKFVYSGFK